ncbi:hypothetical protein PHYSODRAFT_339793 [Phytophthora sojae]|uniref:RXLR phytopathogen effector protein WY-domain domain-containing protein n=1 Tax=Phytophthora sojae (strain P6497) TaxID=1094619 RepID=G5A7M2_PHYSP|nr:hypothetical protein PHYSODRAFT_339793 [Phytophthora sojae]EGZ07898.1 hypothetical protein PHYSODRAFT_339793 [Phytophthora sojae]|eukprot:XP_009536070.1 hypothetical protein PHYSODRAFT_339793 [Phytophthora sojae]
MVSQRTELSEDMRAIFEKIVYKNWLRKKKSADDVFIFVLEEPHDQIFKVRALNTWVSYVTKLDHDDAYKAITRTKELGQRLLQEQWLSESQTAGAVFKQLRLGQDRFRLFKTPWVTLWASYVTKLDPKNADEVVLSVLQPLYTKKELAQLLKAAKGVDETKELATRLAKQLLYNKGREPRKEHDGCSDGLRVSMADDGSRHRSSSRATTAIALQEGGDSMGHCHGGGRPSLRPRFQARGRRPRFKHSSHASTEAFGRCPSGCCRHPMLLEPGLTHPSARAGRTRLTLKSSLHGTAPTAAQQEVQDPRPVSADLVGGEYEPPDLA